MSDFNFKIPELSDREWVKGLLSQSDFRGCLYTFGNNYVWRNAYNIKICRHGDFYLLQNTDHTDGVPRFLYPAGTGNIKKLVAELMDYCSVNGFPLLMTANRECTERLMADFPEISAEPDRDGFDYIYEAEALAGLKGRKYHSKRNHLNRFYENDWSFEPICAANISYCRELLARWLASDNDPEKQAESAVVLESLDNFSELGYSGGMLAVNGEPQAFAFGERSSADTFVIHAEKALLDYQGAYTAINCEFAKVLAENFRYINREDDVGSEGLRKAKLSYHPAFMEEKYLISFGGTA